MIFNVVDQPFIEDQTHVFQDSSTTEKQRSAVKKEEGISNQNYG